MYNAHGWINLRINPNIIENTNTDTIEYDDLYDKLVEKHKEIIISELEKISKEDFWIKYQISSCNNFYNFLTIQYSRNHKSALLKDFYKFVAKNGDASHGLLYEVDDEAENFNEEKPYRVYRLIGNNFEEVDEVFFNGNLNGLEYF